MGDTSDFYRHESQRKLQNSFEGFLTNGVNSQLVKDAHRSEWSVEGRTFSQQAQLSNDGAPQEDRKRAIANFQKEFVEALETYLLDFCRRRELSATGTERLIQAVTTQMSQIGLANLDRSSQAAKYFVSGQGLDQRTAYNISAMDTGPQLGESLKLSMLCMKTGYPLPDGGDTWYSRIVFCRRASPAMCTVVLPLSVHDASVYTWAVGRWL